MNKSDKLARWKVRFQIFYDIVGWPLIATVLGLMVGALVMLAAKFNPIEAYKVMFEKSFFSQYYFLQTLTRSIPIMICGLAAVTAWRAGYPNIGIQGQMTVGGFTAAVIALYMPGPPWLVVLLTLAGGMLAGMIYAIIPTLLNLKCNVHLIISTLMLSYVADHLVGYMVSFPFRDPYGDRLAVQTAQIRESLWFGRVFQGSTFHTGFFLAVIVTIIMTVILNKSSFGYESRMAGYNPSFAKYGGIKQDRIMLITMALSGALAGLAGAIEVLGVKHRYVNAMFADTGYAWTGIMAAMIAQLHPVATFFYSIFLGGLEIAGQAIQRALGLPLEIARIIQTTITIIASIRITVKFIKRRKNKRSANTEPTAEPQKVAEEGA